MPLAKGKLFVIIISESNNNSNKLSQVRNVLFSNTLNQVFVLGISYFVFCMQLQNVKVHILQSQCEEINLQHRI